VNTYYRWRKEYGGMQVNQAKRLKELREQYPRWGKEKLCVLLQERGIESSASTVGRIIGYLKRRGELVEPQTRSKAGRRRVRRPYAVRKPRDWGAVAEAVGQKIRKLSQSYQVICITHLPQVAKFADSHLTVSKAHYDKKTQVTIKNLDGNERVVELARMIGGFNITQKTIDAAQEMLKH